MNKLINRHSPIVTLITFTATFVAFYTGCGSCFFLQTRFAMSPILAASLLGVAITFVPLPSHIEKRAFLFVFCTGTFAAMSSREIISTPIHLLAISLIGSTVYILAREFFVGIGGKMGMLAFVTTAIWLGVRMFS